MAVPARRPLMTAEQLFELPDDGYRSELVEGEIVRMTSTTSLATVNSTSVTARDTDKVVSRHVCNQSSNRRHSSSVDSQQGPTAHGDRDGVSQHVT